MDTKIGTTFAIATVAKSVKVKGSGEKTEGRAAAAEGKVWAVEGEKSSGHAHKTHAKRERGRQGESEWAERRSKKKAEAAGVDNTKQLIKGKLRAGSGRSEAGRVANTADRAANRDRNTINVGSCFQNESAAQKKPQHQQTPSTWGDWQGSEGWEGGVAYHEPSP